MALSTPHLVSAPAAPLNVWQLGEFGDDAYAAPAGPRHPWPSVVAVEGLIGAGKSTLCEKLAAANPALWEPLREQANPLFLALFYADPSKYGWAMQWGMLMSRLYQMRLAERRRVVAGVQEHLARLSEQPGDAGGAMVSRRYSRRPPTLLWDRSMLGDGIFALANYLRGNISHDELAVYESEYGSSITTPYNASWAKTIDYFVFLEDAPAACKRRVEEVRGNASEAGIPEDYYRTLDDLHFNAMIGLASNGAGQKVVVLPWGTYDTAAAVEERIRARASARTATPRVVYTSKPPDVYMLYGLMDARDSVTTDATWAVYDCAEDIQAASATLAQARAAPALLDEPSALKNASIANVVFVPDDASTRLAADETGFRRDSRYDIIAYKDAFKRVVSWHLSREQTVVFYRRSEATAPVISSSSA